MTHLSLFSGAGGFDLGFEWAGHETVAQVEFDPKCREVLARHWPEVPRYEDVCEFDGRDFTGVGIISGGFPCQDLSVAGKRAGLAGARSGLFFELARIVGEARPEFLVWENVCGLLSASDGDAMGAVLHTLADLGYYGAWRVLDSQWHGVAQRRRRVFGVFAEGRAGGERCAEVLLEPEGGGWTPAPRGQAGEDVARCLDSGSGGDSGKEQQRTFVPTTEALQGQGVASPEEVSDAERPGEASFVPEIVGQAISCKWAKGSAGPAGDEHHNLVAMGETGQGFWQPGIQTLRAEGENRPSRPGHVVYHDNPVAFTPGHIRRGKPAGAPQEGLAHTLTSQTKSGDMHQHVTRTTGVRRLVPVEVERLQGFPDGWTDQHTDTHRYRMMGNAVTTNATYWLGLRLMEES